MKLTDLFLNRWLYKDTSQNLETEDSTFVSADSTTPDPSPIASGGAAQDINTGNVTINGGQLTPGTYPVTTLDIANWGWGQTCAFSSTGSAVVSWGAGDFKSASGTTYPITASNTGTMTGKNYIYFNINTPGTYQVTPIPGDSVGIGKVLVAVAQNSTSGNATWNLNEAQQIVGDNILANTIDATKITTGQLIVGTNVGQGTAVTSGGVTTIIGDTVTTGYVNALNVTAQYVVASISISSPSISGGSISIGSGNNIFKADSNGIYLGNAVFASAPFRVDMGGNLTATLITITGGTINYGKTSFTDSTHAGYYISSSGIYMGSVSDTTKLKYDIGTGTFDFIGTISGRSTATIAGAINSSGNLINNIVNSQFDTSTKQILSDFTFGSSGALRMNTDANNGLWISSTGILGKTSGVTTFAIDTSGNASFRGTVVVTGTSSGYSNFSDKPTLGTLAGLSSVGASNCDSTIISGGKIITGLLTASNIQAGTLTVGDGTSNTIAITINQSTAGGGGTTSAFLKWSGGSKIWSDTSNYIGYNAIGGYHYFYTNNNENVVIIDGNQTIFNYGISCRGPFNVGTSSVAQNARVTGNLYINPSTATTQYLVGTTNSIYYYSGNYHYFESNGVEELKISSSGVSISNNGLYLAQLTSDGSVSVGQDGAMYYNTSLVAVRARVGGSWISLGSGGGSGTVTQVNASGSNGVTVSGVPFSTSGTIAISLGAITPTTGTFSGNVTTTANMRVATGLTTGASYFFGSATYPNEIFASDSGSFIFNSIYGGTYYWNIYNGVGTKVQAMALSNSTLTLTYPITSSSTYASSFSGAVNFNNSSNGCSFAAGVQFNNGFTVASGVTITFGATTTHIGNIVPNAANTYFLGSTTNYYSAIYTNSIGARGTTPFIGTTSNMFSQAYISNLGDSTHKCVIKGSITACPLPVTENALEKLDATVHTRTPTRKVDYGNDIAYLDVPDAPAEMKKYYEAIGDDPAGDDIEITKTVGFLYSCIKEMLARIKVLEGK